MLHDLRNGTIGSKRAVADWAKANMGRSWIGLIDRTWAGRPNLELLVRQPADPQDLASTLEFIQDIIGKNDLVAADLEIDRNL